MALAAGIAWGFVMAFLAFRWDGAEVVLVQSWILCPAWLVGRAVGDPRGGALAGLALVAGAVWTYELLPGWGLEAALAARGAQPTESAAVVLQFDREDIVLVSTQVIGALVGLAGGLRVPAPAPEPAVAPEPEPQPAFLPPAPLWARLEAPAPPEPPAPAPAPAAVRAPRPAIPWGPAFLLAALATDLFLDRLFDMYTRPQGAVALAFLAAGLVVAGALARRYAIAMLVAGLILGSAFAAVQHAEYQDRDGTDARGAVA